MKINFSGQPRVFHVHPVSFKNLVNGISMYFLLSYVISWCFVGQFLVIVCFVYDVLLDKCQHQLIMTLPTCHVNDPIVTQKNHVVSRAPQWKRSSTFQYLPNCESKNATSSSPQKGFLITPFRQLPNFLGRAYNPFEKCARQTGSFPNTGENKNISNHHPVSYWLFVILDTVLPFCWLHQRGKLQIQQLVGSPKSWY